MSHESEHPSEPLGGEPAGGDSTRSGAEPSQAGWEAAEADLIENATHGDGGGDPIGDALTPEVEAGRSTATYGESDELESTETVEDPATGKDDPAEGPGIAADRGPAPTPRQDR